MGGIRGFLLKRRVTSLSRKFSRRCLNLAHRVKPFRGLIRWAHKLRRKATLGKNTDQGRNYLLFGQESVVEKPVPVPKGHTAVYVGHKDGDIQRILVPVVYFNHPLFGDLLKESENEYGFDQPGGLTIPCRISEFERVQTRIKTVQCTRKLLRRKNPNKSLTARRIDPQNKSMKHYLLMR